VPKHLPILVVPLFLVDSHLPGLEIQDIRAVLVMLYGVLLARVQVDGIALEALPVQMETGGMGI